jgi:hypothetical protein
VARWYVVSTINNDGTTAMPGQGPRQRAVATAKIKNGASCDLDQPLGHPIMHVADHGKVLSRELVGGEPLWIMIEVSGQRLAFRPPSLIVLVGRPTRLDHLASPHTTGLMCTVLFKLALSCNGQQLAGIWPGYWPQCREPWRQTVSRGMLMSTSGSTTAPAPRSALWRRWPAAVGLLGAAFVAMFSPDRDTIIIGLLVALTCYLSAAALGVRWVAWAAIPVATALLVAGGLADIEPWYVLGGTSVVLVVIGLLRAASRTALAAQALAMVAYGGIALVALTLGPVAGAVLASSALMAHAVWDVIHYRRNAVVPRSLAEACIFFDVPLGLAAIALALAGLS